MKFVCSYKLFFILHIVYFCTLNLYSQSIRVIGLYDAEHLGVQNNFDIRSARIEKGIAHQAVNARFRDFLPSVSMSYRRNRQIAERNFDNGSHSVQMSVSQPVFDGGRSKLAYDISQIEERLAGEKIKELKNKVRFQIREAYLGLIQTREKLRINEKSLKNLSSVLEKSKIEFRQGEISRLDLEEIENQYSQRKLTIELEKKSFFDGLEDLGLMLHIPVSTVIDIKELALYTFGIREIKYDDDELYQMALHNRSDVRQARIALMRSRKEYYITKYDYLPTIALTGNYGKTGEQWPPQTAEWGIGVRFTFRIFGNSISTDANENRSQNETSRGYSTSGQLNLYDDAAWREPHMRNELALLKARTENKDLIEELKLKVKRIRRDYKIRKQKLDLNKNALDINIRRFKIQLLQLNQGELSINDYIEAELETNQAMLDMINERIEFILQAGKIEMELGLNLDELGLVRIEEENKKY